MGITTPKGEIMLKSLPYFFGALCALMMLAALSLAVIDHGWVLKGKPISIIATGFTWLCLLNGVWIMLALGIMEIGDWLRHRGE